MPKGLFKLAGIVIILVTVFGIAMMRYLQVQRRQSSLDASLLEVAEHGTVSQAEYLLSQGANIEARRRSEQVTVWEPLHKMMTEIKYPNYPFQLGYTPLMFACIRGDEVMVGFLLRHGANRGACERIHGKGSNPLDLATTYNHPNIVQLLKTAGAK